jgi:hypothetical protein
MAIVFNALLQALTAPPTPSHAASVAAVATAASTTTSAEKEKAQPQLQYHSLEHTVPAAGLAALEALTALTPHHNKRLAEEGKTLSEAIDALLLGGEEGDDDGNDNEIDVENEEKQGSKKGSNGVRSHGRGGGGNSGGGAVLLFPSLPHLAPRHGAGLLRFLDTANTSVWNALEQPAVHVPMGLTSSGGGGQRLPVGVQVVAARGNDHLCVAVAQALERAGVAVSPRPF